MTYKIPFLLSNSYVQKKVTISVASADMLSLHTFEGHADVCQNIWHVVTATQVCDILYDSVPANI